MKLLTFFLSAALYLGYPTTNFLTSEKTVNLAAALKSGLVKIKVKGLGGYSGKCLEASLTTTSPRLNVLIKAGTVFKPEDSGMQDILVVKDQMITLNKNTPGKVQLTGFCCKASNRSPSKDTKFTTGKVSNTKLIDIAEYLNKNKFSDDVMQNAVWCVSDDKSVSYIYDKKPETVKALREELCKLTGQKNNWFHTNASRTVDERGYIESQPVRVTGEIVVKVDKPMVLYQGVYKENGEVAWAPHKVSDINSVGTMTYQFKLHVKGWEKGKYYVQVTNSGKELLKQEFII